MKRFAPRVEKVKEDCIGLDVHQNLIVFSHLDVEGGEAHTGRVKPAKEEVWTLVEQLGEGRPLHVTMEATGGMLWLYDFLYDRLPAGHVHVAQAKRIRAIANSKEKNDGNDAFWLAYLTYEGRLPECWIPRGALRELRQACRQRIEAVRLRTRAIQAVRALLRQMGEEVPTRRLLTKGGLEFLEALLARTEGVLGEALRVAWRRVGQAGAEVAAWEGVIRNLAEGIPEVRLLAEKVPGVGPTLAALIVAESGDMMRFLTPRAYARFTGLTPSDRSTGGRMIHGAITREGSSHLRWALTQAVMACLRGSRGVERGPAAAVARWVDQKERRTGIRAKVRVAAARKLATVIWWLFHAPEEFDACKPFGSGVK